MGTASARLPTVSVVICAYSLERWPELAAAIESIVEGDEQPDEIIVVADHNSTLLERMRAEFPHVLAVENTGPRGLSGARNAGIARATGEVVAFIDDDAVAEREWLGLLRACFLDGSVAGAGGSVEPEWSGRRPRWFPEEFDWVVGCTYRGLPEETAPVRNLIGANMAVRRHLFDLVGGFEPALGRGGANTMGCEETDFFIRARRSARDSVLLLEPAARVRHRVPMERQSIRYFLRRCFGEGKSKALLVRRLGSSDGLSAERRYTLHVLPQGVLRGVAVVGRRDFWGPVRSAAIIAGLTTTAAGYVAARGASIIGAGRVGALGSSPDGVDGSGTFERGQVDA